MNWKTKGFIYVYNYNIGSQHIKVITLKNSDD